VIFDESGDPLDVYHRRIADPPRKLVPRGSVALKLGADKHVVAKSRDDVMPFARSCRRLR